MSIAAIGSESVGWAVPTTAHVPAERPIAWAQPTLRARSAGGVESAGAADFAHVLRDVQSSAAESNKDVSGGKANDAASRFVADLFVMPLLSEMRKFPFGRKFADGGRGEEVFGEQFDQRIADIAAGGGFRTLTGMIADRMNQLGTSDRRESVADMKAAEPARPTVE